MIWVLDYLDDLDADFRTFYRFPADGSAPGIADGEFGNLSSPRFFLLAERTAAYSGVIAARLAYEKQKEENKTQQRERPAKATARSQPAAQERRQVTMHQLMLIDPTLIQYERV